MTLLLHRPGRRRDPRQHRRHANSAKIGENLAAEIVADSEGKANTLYVNISAFQILQALGEQFEKHVQAVLPDCALRDARRPADLARQGRAGPDRVLPAQPPAGQLRRAVGEQRARRRASRPRCSAAGLADKVKIVGQSGDPQTFQDLQAKNLSRVVAVRLLRRRLPDARRAGAPLRGRPAAADDAAAVDRDAGQHARGRHEGPVPGRPDYRDEFKKLWGK